MARTERLLALLDLLQRRPVWSGTELAERLGVTTRSVRRDIEELRRLGYPVNSTQGSAGGYQLGAGRGMPPLLLDDEEAVAVAVSLRLAATGNLSGASEPALRTLAKLDQVMPPRLRAEVAAIRDATETIGQVSEQVDGDTLLRLARACRDLVRVRFGYESRTGARTERYIEPVRLVATQRRWYLMAFDLDRDDWRTFRLDRMSEVEATIWRFRGRAHPDPAEFVQRGITEGAYRHQARVRFLAPAATVRAKVPPTAGRVVARGRTACLLHCGAEDLTWLALHLLAVGEEFEVEEPAELVEELATLRARIPVRG